MSVSEWESEKKRRELGHRLQKLRAQKGLTQLDMAISAGCSKNYISALERGVNKCTVPYLLEYCKALHITPDQALGYSEPPRNTDEAKEILDTLDDNQYALAIRLLKAIRAK